MNALPSGTNATLNDPVLMDLVEDAVARIQAGEAVDVDSWCREHPEQAEGLRRLWPAIQMMAHLGQSADAALSGLMGERDGWPVEGCLGDFRIVRQVGRGGMGVVYEAVQLSLNRQVALKVLPFAANMDARQLQRFKIEAQAAAILHHSHIVPVYAVGCARGVHYYAMQFIDGYSLAQFIAHSDELTSPNVGAGDETPRPAATEVPRDAKYCRRVAGWGVQAAEALEYAHGMDVVHRDIKPGNLMIDRQDLLWVTDFGLARMSADSNLTISSDVMGTLRYMSPEQAMGKNGLVDHRTDVYSLGATLYELLTGVPAVEGQDRQEILRRIAFEEPRAPRALNAALPRDLETVVLKALAKEPAERYGTAQELADDLRRFLADEPVRAKRPTLTERASKWAWRHRALLRWASVLSVLSVAALLVSLVVALRQKSLAESRLKVAREAVDDMWGEFAEEWLAREPGKEEAQRRFLLKALRFYEEFAREAGSDPAVRFRVAQASERVGDIHRRLLDYPEAKTAYARSIPLYKALAGRHSNRPEYRHALGDCYLKLGFSSDPEYLETAKQHSQAVAVFQQLAADFPDERGHRHRLAYALTCLAHPLQLSGQIRESEAFRRLSVATLEKLLDEVPGDADYLRTLGMARYYLGTALGESGRLEDAGRVYAEAEQCYARLAPPGTPGYWDKLKPYDWFNRAKLWVWQGELQSVLKDGEGEVAVLRGIGVLQKLSADFPRIPHYSEGLGNAWRVLGDLRDRAGRAREADEAYQQAVKVREKGMAEAPENPEAFSTLSRLLSRWPREQFRDSRRALELARRATDLEPRRAEYWFDLGIAHYRAGDHAAAIQALDKSRSLVGQNGDVPDNWLFLAMAHWRRGDRGQARHWYNKAAGWMQDHPLEQARQRRLLAEVSELLGAKEPGQPDN